MTETRLKLDLHIHSTVSDGTDSPLQLLEKVKKAGLSLFSLTDHDGIAGCCELLERSAPGDPAFITGVEFSCRDAEGKYHILGYGYDPASPSIKNVVELGHAYRLKKMSVRLAFLREEFGFVFPESEIRELFALPNPGKPHLGNLMVKHGFASSRDVAIDQIDRLTVEKTDFVRPEEAIEGILGAGGIPVLAHPCYGDGEQLILGDELDARVARLKSFGLRGLEGYYYEHTAEHRAGVLELAEKYSLLVTAGSDHHGANKPNGLGETGLDSEARPAEGLLRFLDEIESRLTKAGQLLPHLE